MMGRLEGKVALVTGAARGIGKAVTERFVAEGAKVVVADVLEQAGRELVEGLRGDAAYVRLDVTSPGEWELAVQETVEGLGGLSVLVNNAGILDSGRIDAFAYEQWRRIIDVNLTGVFNGIKAAAPALIASAPSSVINVSSIAGLRGYENLAGYTASKFGVRGLTKAAALDLSPAGVRVNSIHPGVIETPMTAGMSFDTAHVPAQRIGQPEEVASLAVYLASDESGFVTGAEFVIDGGEMAGMVGPA